ncbi:MAG TPA: PilC/PilY family type IV pilus protein [Thiohalobacter sp.]|nr:PilC/PilY family type IV pilus protein [Thiohalobacter sp.]
MKQTLKTALISRLLGAAIAAYGLSVHAAPGTLSDVPLFVTNPVEPNIMLLVDDSGSMDWEHLLSNRASQLYPGAPTDWVHLDPTPSETAEYREWCAPYNVMAYNPNITYTPWSGVDSSGAPFSDIPVSAAPFNPNDPSSDTLDLENNACQEGELDSQSSAGCWTNSVGFFYVKWNDANGNGQYDAMECVPPIADLPTDSDYFASSITSGGQAEFIRVKDMTAAEKQNYANWFSYYRKREYVAKSAFGSVIANQNSSRMGMASLHNNNSVNTAIASMNQDPASGAKRQLLDQLYSIYSSGGTPLRRRLEDAGEYLSCQSNGFGFGCPALPSNSGGECQQNFTLLMTDGFWNGSAPSVGNADGDNSSSFDGGSYADSYSNTLADVAMHFYETDIRPTVDNKVPTKTGVDENDAQHMVTYTIAFGVNGTLSAMPADPAAAFSWPRPNSGGVTTIDDLRHAAWNGRGQFLSADDPDGLRQQINSAIDNINSRKGSASAVSFNSGSLNANSQLFLALFNSENWSGQLQALDLDPSNGDITGLAWDAATELDDPAVTENTRTILTYDGSDGIPLRWSDLSAAQQADFRTNPSGGTDVEAVGMARLGHLRGDRDCETGNTSGGCSYDDGSNTFTTANLRSRSSRLGDIVHSSPTFAGAPSLRWPDRAPFPSGTGNTYSEYKQSQSSRIGVIYAGANDGLLHAFRQSDGAEILAYAPNALFSANTTAGYHYLSDPAYGHRYYVDMTPSIMDAYVKTSATGTRSWHTVLVGALRGGGRGLFALDVTNPSGFSETGSVPADVVMWEFTHADDPNLGLSFSQPQIVPLAGPGNTVRWAAVFGNGYNADGGTGSAQLFIVLLEGGLDGTWTIGPGNDYIRIDTGAGDIDPNSTGNTSCQVAAADCNGLATPVLVDIDSDGVFDRAYAGDLKGNLWAFDLSGDDMSQWDVAYKNSGTPVALFQGAANQPITAKPAIVRNTDVPTGSANKPNFMVLFGTGQYLTSSDPHTTHGQSFYGVWDAGNSLPNASNLPLTRSELVEQTIGTDTTTGGVTGRTLTNNTVDYTASPPDYGWYMDLPTAGERQTTDALVRGDLVYFTTLIPDTDVCAAGGSGWLMFVKASNGGRPDKVAVDISGDGVLDQLDEIGGEAAAGTQLDGQAAAVSILGDTAYVSTSKAEGVDPNNPNTPPDCDDAIGDCSKAEELNYDDTGRLSWEEVVIE